MADSSFYEPLDDEGTRWRSTAATSGPWGPEAQHGGPPSALLARAIERCAPREEMTVARMTVELLGSVPVAELAVQARLARPGRSVELLEATLSAGGREVARASAWRVRRADGVRVAQAASAPLPLPEGLPELSVEGIWSGGYLRAVEWRPVAGRFDVPGPATAWTRLRVPVVPDEAPSPLQRVLAVADSGNGLSAELDVTRWWFINPELTVHVHREAVGEWVCVEAATTVSDGGCGLATTVLSDVSGPLGRGAQSLLVAPRPAV